MRNLIVRLVGYFLRKLNALFSEYQNKWIIKRLGKAGRNATIKFPFKIIGENNLYLEEGVNIGPGSTIYTTRAKIFIGKKSFSGPNLTMISGDHPFISGTYMLDLRKDLLPNAKDFDNDIVIEQDVWIGANVTILKGVRIGRGAIIAAGSVVVRTIPPYAIAGGIPAKVLKFKWEIDEILKHESFLIENINDRMNKEQVCEMMNSYLN